MKSNALKLGWLAALPAAAMLVACGGGGGDPAPVTPPSTQATVTSAAVTNAKYSQNALVTINGTNLDSGLTVTSATCTGMARSTTAPNISTATTAYYTCKVGTVADNQAVSIVRTSDSTTLSTPTFNVPLPQVTMTVSDGAAINGSMVITLEAVKTPITVDNFLAYVNSGYYVNTIFHRVLKGFVIQGGGLLSNGSPKPGALAPITLEVGKGLSNVQWSIAMARTTELNSATSQFYVNTVDNLALDTTGGGYAVFGSVTSNTALVTAIENAPCSGGTVTCLPVTPIVITAATQSR